MRKTSRKKPTPKIIKAAPLPKLVEISMRLATVKGELVKAGERIIATGKAHIEAQKHNDELRAEHKDLQEQLNSEALLVKPE